MVDYDISFKDYMGKRRKLQLRLECIPNMYKYICCTEV